MMLHDAPFPSPPIDTVFATSPAFSVADAEPARAAAIDFEKPVITNIEQALVSAEALEMYGSTEGVVPRGTFQEGDVTEVETYVEFMDMAK